MPPYSSAMLLIPLPSVLSGVVNAFVKQDFKKYNITYLQPPSWVFGVVWSTIYLLYGVYAYLVVSRAVPDAKVLLLFWCINLALNLSWTSLFKAAKFREGAWGIAGMIGTLIAMFTLTDYKWARLCLVPYVSWLVVALLLNVEIARKFHLLDQQRLPPKGD